MDKIVALCICIPFFAVFIPQYGLQVVNNDIMIQSGVIIDAAKEEAKQAGYFTEDILSDMKENLAEIGVEVQDADITVTTTPKYRINEYDEREMIEYNISINVGKAIAAGGWFGIPRDENVLVKNYHGKIASEALQ